MLRNVCWCCALQDAYILTANISLEYEKAEVNAGFFYSSAEQREALVAAERAYTDERCRKVIELKKKVRGCIAVRCVHCRRQSLLAIGLAALVLRGGGVNASSWDFVIASAQCVRSCHPLLRMAGT
jgi:hypothetical protein